MSRSINETTTSSNNMSRSINDTASGNNMSRSINETTTSNNMSRSINDAASSIGNEGILPEDHQLMTPPNQRVPSPSQRKKMSSIFKSLGKKLGLISKRHSDRPLVVAAISTLDEELDDTMMLDEDEYYLSSDGNAEIAAMGLEIRKGIREAGEEISKGLRAPLVEFTNSIQKMNQQWYTGACVTVQAFLRCVLVGVWANVTILFVGSPYHTSLTGFVVAIGAFIGMSVLTLHSAATMVKSVGGPEKSVEELEEERKLEEKRVRNARERAAVRALELEASKLQAMDALRKAKAVERKAVKEAEKKSKRANRGGARDNTHA